MGRTLSIWSHEEEKLQGGKSVFHLCPNCEAQQPDCPTALQTISPMSTPCRWAAQGRRAIPYIQVANKVPRLLP